MSLSVSHSHSRQWYMVFRNTTKNNKSFRSVLPDLIHSIFWTGGNFAWFLFPMVYSGQTWYVAFQEWTSFFRLSTRMSFSLDSPVRLHVQMEKTKPSLRSQLFRRCHLTKEYYFTSLVTDANIVVNCISQTMAFGNSCRRKDFLRWMSIIRK